MSLVSFSRGLWWPEQQGVAGTFTNTTLNAAGLQNAFYGRCYIQGRAANKVISAAGGGQVGILAGAVTFANGGTTIDLGIQNMTSATAPTPSGVFDVKRTLTGGVDTIVNGLNMFALNTSGTKTISNGDVIAIVTSMTARGGVDSVALQGYNSTSMFMHYNTNQAIFPSSSVFNGATWGGGGQGIMPSSFIIFDDGTLGHIEGSYFGTNVFDSNFSSGTNPNERGLIFQMPFACKVDSFMFSGSLGSAGLSDFIMSLYSTPLGTPVVLSSVTFIGGQGGAVPFGTGMVVLNLPSEITLTANTDYCVAIRATGSGPISLDTMVLFNQSHRALLLPGGTTVKKVTRNGGAGAFTAENPAVTLYSMGVRISAVDTGGGAAAGGGAGLKMGLSI